LAIWVKRFAEYHQRYRHTKWDTTSYKFTISLLKYGICPKIIGLKNIATQVTQNIISSGGSGTFFPQIALDRTDKET
jgi:hypothetical protein